MRILPDRNDLYGFYELPTICAPPVCLVTNYICLLLFNSQPQARNISVSIGRDSAIERISHLYSALSMCVCIKNWIQSTIGS